MIQRVVFLVLIAGMITVTLHEFTHILQQSHQLCDTPHHYADQEREDEHQNLETTCFYCIVSVAAPISDYSCGETHFRTIVLKFIRLHEHYSPSLLTDILLRAPPQISA